MVFYVTKETLEIRMRAQAAPRGNQRTIFVKLATGKKEKRIRFQYSRSLRSRLLHAHNRNGSERAEKKENFIVIAILRKREYREYATSVSSYTLSRGRRPH